MRKQACCGLSTSYPHKDRRFPPINSMSIPKISPKNADDYGGRMVNVSGIQTGDIRCQHNQVPLVVRPTRHARARITREGSIQQHYHSSCFTVRTGRQVGEQSGGPYKSARCLNSSRRLRPLLDRNCPSTGSGRRRGRGSCFGMEAPAPTSDGPT